MLRVFVVGVSEQGLEGPPVLDHLDVAESPAGSIAEQTPLILLLQLLQHARHGQEDRQPLVDLPERVHSHADEEDREILVQVGSEASGLHTRHEKDPLFLVISLEKAPSLCRSARPSRGTRLPDLHSTTRFLADDAFVWWLARKDAGLRAHALAVPLGSALRDRCSRPGIRRGGGKIRILAFSPAYAMWTAILE